MTQITLLSLISLTVLSLWSLVAISAMSALYLRRREVAKRELAYVVQHPPMPYARFRRSPEDTQELRALNPIPVSVDAPQYVVRHINPSQLVSIEIHPDIDPASAEAVTETNLHRLYAHLAESQNSR